MATLLSPRPAIYGILISSAHRRAGSALDGFRVDDPMLTRMAIDAGVAVEHMAKAFLAAHHPALLIPDRAPKDTFLHLAGHGDLAASPLHDVKTVGLEEACRRVKWFLPTFSFSDVTDRPVVLARNSVAHLGEIPEPVVHDALRSMARLLSELATGLGMTPEDDLWSDEHLEMVRHLVDESLQQPQRLAYAKIEAAKRAFRLRFRAVDDERRMEVARSFEGRQGWATPHQHAEECPACGLVGWTAFEGIDRGASFTAPNWVTGEPARYIHQDAVPLGFDCSVCGLSLEGPEVSAVGLTTNFEMPDRLLEADEQ